MEVGAVKQAFNNEVILLKKKLNQAKIQIIHKLTRKAKQLAEKKAPEPLKEKFKKKAESAVNEVLIMKKIKPKDLAKFIVTHKGELKDFLNKPTVDIDKACARLLLHKALQDKYKSIRGTFSNMNIKDLFMSRQERLKLKKEAKDKQKEKNKKKKEKKNKVVNSEGDWNVEDVKIDVKKVISDEDDEELNGAESNERCEDGDALSEGENDDRSEDDDKSQSENESQSQEEESEQSEVENESDDDAEVIEQKANMSESEEDNSEPEIKESSKPIKTTAKAEAAIERSKPELNRESKKVTKRNPEKKQKDINKIKNFNEKMQQKKSKKDAEAPLVGNKIVDPFFITSTGEKYLSVVEPRGPDEVKVEHKQGNRKHRRAVMFGHVSKPKPRRNNNNYDNDRFNNGNDKGNQFNNRQEFGNDRKQNNGLNDKFNDRKRFNDKNNDEKPEKLHPSWEAKKKKSGILPFEGKKIVFD